MYVVCFRKTIVTPCFSLPDYLPRAVCLTVHLIPVSAPRRPHPAHIPPPRSPEKAFRAWAGWVAQRLRVRRTTQLRRVLLEERQRQRQLESVQRYARCVCLVIQIAVQFEIFKYQCVGCPPHPFRFKHKLCFISVLFCICCVGKSIVSYYRLTCLCPTLIFAAHYLVRCCSFVLR